MHAIDLTELNESPADGGAKRRQIMEGARAEFLKSGFDGTSMNDIARSAGVSKGTLYVYFPSKEHLFEALIREERRQQAERTCRPAFELATPREVLTRFGLNLMELMCRPETLAHLRTVIAASAKFPQLGRAFFEAGPLYGATVIRDYLVEQTARGTLNVPDPDIAAWQFLDLCKSGGIYQRLLFGIIDEIHPDSFEASIASAVDMFMAAYGPKAD
jgi:AcrR family transcriptional regulator